MLNIRDATASDASVIAEIYNESIAVGDSTMHDEPKTTEAIRRQMEGFSDREGFMVLESDGYIVGWGVIKLYSHRSGYRFCCETSVFLRRTETRKGYGSFLKKAVIERCRKYGYHHLLARIFADNVASIEYNKSLGYEMVGVQREIGYKNGRWQDVAVMQLVLDDVVPEPE
jgi:phosphinothricin acetyltransferase